MIKNKLFIVKKYIYAKSAKDAIKKEKGINPDDVWVDEDWRLENIKKNNEKEVGFNK